MILTNSSFHSSKYQYTSASVLSTSQSSSFANVHFGCYDKQTRPSTV